MVCVPCIVIPVLLWIFHRFIQPYVLKFWNPWQKKLPQHFTKHLNKEDLESDSYKYIKEKISNNPIVVFTKKGCGFCDMVKEVFQKLDAKYLLESIDEKKDCQEIQNLFFKMTGEKTVPRVFVGGNCIGGGTDTYTLFNEKKLHSLLLQAGADFKKNN